MIFQDPMASLDPRQNVESILTEPLTSHDVPGGKGGHAKRVRELLDWVGLPTSALARYPHEFSGGQRQRIGIARALALDPALVVLDEPVSALDVSVRGEVLVMLNRLRADFGLSFLIATHDLDVVRVVADRVLVLEGGRVVEATTPAQMLEAPQHPTTQQLVAAQLPDVGIVPVF
jgi:peptide/nickel transport system ATP-binding protein